MGRTILPVGSGERPCGKAQPRVFPARPGSGSGSPSQAVAPGTARLLCRCHSSEPRVSACRQGLTRSALSPSCSCSACRHATPRRGLRRVQPSPACRQAAPTSTGYRNHPGGPGARRAATGASSFDPRRATTRCTRSTPAKLLMPGSTMKIVTLAAAAERLGWNYVYDTRLVAAGPIEAGVLNGDLVVVGSGDPSILDGEVVASGVFAGWAETLKANGIRTITGRIIGDDNAFDDETLGPGWAWDDLPGPRRRGRQRACSTTRIRFRPRSRLARAIGAAADGAICAAGQRSRSRQRADDRCPRNRSVDLRASIGWKLRDSSCADRSRSRASPSSASSRSTIQRCSSSPCSGTR